LVVVVAVNAAGARLLDMIGLTESLLSANPARAAIAALLGIVFFVARLLAYFVAPGLVIAALVAALITSARRS
jgi:hypothetical protein